MPPPAQEAALNIHPGSETASARREGGAHILAKPKPAARSRAGADPKAPPKPIFLANGGLY
jgi:hypothetical protein